MLEVMVLPQYPQAPYIRLNALFTSRAFLGRMLEIMVLPQYTQAPNIRL